MTRSTDFGVTVRHGVRAAQANLGVHALRADDEPAGDPRIGLVVAKSVGTAVQRHGVARRLRHVARGIVDELGAGDRVVIRALPGSPSAGSARLDQVLRTALQRAVRSMGGPAR